MIVFKTTCLKNSNKMLLPRLCEYFSSVSFPFLMHQIIFFQLAIDNSLTYFKVINVAATDYLSSRLDKDVPCSYTTI